MGRIFNFVPLILCCVFSCHLLVPEPAAGQRQPAPQTLPNLGAGPTRGFSVNGMVSDAATHTRLDGVRVELQSFGGGVIQTAFTSGNGTFQMNNIGSGSYTLV